MIQISYINWDSIACLPNPMPNLNEGQISQSVVLKAKIGIHSARPSSRSAAPSPSADFASRLNIRPARSTELVSATSCMHSAEFLLLGIHFTPLEHKKVFILKRFPSLKKVI